MFKLGPGDTSHGVTDDPGLTPNRISSELQSESTYAVDGNIGLQFDKRK